VSLASRVRSLEFLVGLLAVIGLALHTRARRSEAQIQAIRDELGFDVLYLNRCSNRDTKGRRCFLQKKHLIDHHYFTPPPGDDPAAEAVHAM
jgi:hypothetical protein